MKKIQYFMSIVLMLLFLCFISNINVYASDYDFSFSIDTDDEGNLNGMDIKSPYNQNGKDVLDDSVAKGVVWNKLLIRYKVLIVGFMGFATLTLIAIGMYNFTKLSVVSTNPQKKTEAMMGIAITFIAAAILGGGTVLFGYAYNVFR